VPTFGVTTGVHGFGVDPVEGVVVPVPVVEVTAIVPVVVVPDDAPTFVLSASVPVTGVPVDIGLSHSAADAADALAVAAASWAAPTISLLDDVRVEMPSGNIAATE